MPATTIIPSRCWRFQAFTAYGENPRIEYWREKVRVYDDGAQVHDTLPTATRFLTAIAAQPIPGGPVTVATMADLYNLVADCGHQFAAEDDAAAAKAAADAAAALAAQQAAAKAAQTTP